MTITADEVIKTIKTELKDYILTKKPGDLHDAAKAANAPNIKHVGRHNGDWFLVNDRNQVQWNWKNSTLPAWYIVVAKGQEFFEAYCHVAGGEIYRAIQSVLNSKDIKAIKARLREGNPKKIENLQAQIKNIDMQFVDLRRRRKVLKNELYTLLCD